MNHKNYSENCTACVTIFCNNDLLGTEKKTNKSNETNLLLRCNTTSCSVEASKTFEDPKF